MLTARVLFSMFLSLGSLDRGPLPGRFPGFFFFRGLQVLPRTDRPLSPFRMLMAMVAALSSPDDLPCLYPTRKSPPPRLGVFFMSVMFALLAGFTLGKECVSLLLDIAPL